MNLGGDPSQALVHSNPDGKFTVALSSIDLGQGMKSVTRQIAAETLGVPVEDVYVDTANSDTGPHCMGSFASRGTHRVGNAVIQAAKEARAVMMEAAAEELEVNPDDLVTDGKGNIHVKGAPSRSISDRDGLRGRAVQAGQDRVGPRHLPGAAVPRRSRDRRDDAGDLLRPRAMVVDIEVDDETGEVAVTQMNSAYELGRALNPKLVEQQLIGGAWMGMSHALWETTEPYYPDRSHGPVDFNDYLMPGPGDIAPHHISILERPAPDGPFGGKGPGEMCANPVLPAVANAVFNAVGVRITDLPITPEKVLRGIKANGGAKPQRRRVTMDGGGSSLLPLREKVDRASARRMRGREHLRRLASTPHPAAAGHLLPRGEKGECRRCSNARGLNRARPSHHRRHRQPEALRAGACARRSISPTRGWRPPPIWRWRSASRCCSKGAPGRRQDGGRQGDLGRARARADPAAVLRGHRRRGGALRMELSAPDAGDPPGGRPDVNIYGDEFLIARPMLEALRAPETSTLLIDEIDRSDHEFEAFLLEFLSDFQISIPERGTVRATERPVVVLTSNRTRELHEALRRRCVYHWIGYPDAAREARIVMMRALRVAETTAGPWSPPSGGCGRSRSSKPPGVAETVEWAEAATLLQQGRRALAGRVQARHRRRAEGPGRSRVHLRPARRGDHRGGGMSDRRLPRAARPFLTFVDAAARERLRGRAGADDRLPRGDRAARPARSRGHPSRRPADAGAPARAPRRLRRAVPPSFPRRRRLARSAPKRTTRTSAACRRSSAARTSRREADEDERSRRRGDARPRPWSQRRFGDADRAKRCAGSPARRPARLPRQRSYRRMRGRRGAVATCAARCATPCAATAR